MDDLKKYNIQIDGHFNNVDKGKVLDVPLNWILGRGATPISGWPLLPVFKEGIKNNKLDIEAYKKALNITDKDFNVAVVQAAFTNDNLDPACGYLLESGRILVWDGHHRITKQVAKGAKSVKIFTIPCPAWLDLELRVTKLYKYNAKRLYQDIDHPWFQDWPTQRDTGRYAAINNIIKKHDLKNGAALDVACSTGSITRELSKLGFVSFGVDNEEGAISVAQQLNLVFDRKIMYINARFDKWPNAMHWSVITCLSFINHYFHRGEYDVGVATIAHLAKKSKLLIIDFPGETMCPPRTLGKAPVIKEAQIKWLREITKKNVEYFGTFEGRNAYAIS